MTECRFCGSYVSLAKGKYRRIAGAPVHHRCHKELSQYPANEQERLVWGR